MGRCFFWWDESKVINTVKRSQIMAAKTSCYFCFHSKVEEISSWELNAGGGWEEMWGDGVEECKLKEKNEFCALQEKMREKIEEFAEKIWQIL